MDLTERPRRNRRTPAIRAIARETRLDAGQLIYPLFVHDGAADIPLESLPGQTRWSLEGLVAEAGRALALGVDKVVVFPKIDDALKSRKGKEATNDTGLVPRAVRALKAAHPQLCVLTDVALDPYSSDGHDGVVNDAGEIDNDASVRRLALQAVCHAKAGADLVSPSDMMDGRVGAIREALDDAGFTGVGIMSYSVKYASAYYGPFRGALDSAPRSDAAYDVPADKSTYQMDSANVREALREVEADEDEGADMVMVKPAGPYLDVVRAVREHTQLPVAAYQVSGEYLMIKAAAQSGWVDEQAVVMESLLGIRRAGADVILTYFAPQVAAWLKA